jgi:hypothetical protein
MGCPEKKKAAGGTHGGSFNFGTVALQNHRVQKKNAS